LDKIPDRIDSKFRFVLLSAARAEQMIQGASARSEGDSPKFTRVAMDEITSDAVDWDYGPAPEPEVDEVIEDGDDAEANEVDKA
jgi:DNA-directed RNA polymerase omega subunit